MKILSILKKMFSSRKDVQNNEQEELIYEGDSQMLVSEESTVAQDSDLDNEEDNQPKSVESKEELITKNFNNMLSTKSELLKEGIQLLEKCQDLDCTSLSHNRGQKKDESPEEYRAWFKQLGKLRQDVKDWREYARLYIYKNQIIPDHYDEFMKTYRCDPDIETIIRHSMRIIETCK